MRIIGNDPSVPRQTQEVASGTLPNGKPVVVNADGTVSVVAEYSASEAKGSAVSINSSASLYFGAAYDTYRQKVVIGYMDDGNSDYGTVAVGTVSGDSISFETPVVFNQSHTRDVRIVFDTASNKNVILYRDVTASTVNSIVGSIDSSGIITFGSPVTLASGVSNYLDLGYDSTNNKAIAVYQQGSNSYAQVGTVSGTSISYGTAVGLGTASMYNGITYDTANQKVVIIYRHGVSPYYGKALVGTVSGTSISFGSEIVFNTANTSWTGIAYDSLNEKVVIAYRDAGSDNAAFAAVGTVSGTSITFGTRVEIDTGSVIYMDCVYHAAAQKTAIIFSTPNPERYLSVRMATVSGTSISLSTQFTLNSAKSYDFERGATYDPNAKKIVASFSNETALSGAGYATAIVYEPTFTENNLTSENYIGISRSGAADTAGAIINTQGAIADNLSGLTAGQSYYVQNDGTLGIAADNPSVFAGTAVSATKLIVKG